MRSILVYLTPAAIGPVWPFMLLATVFMAATSGFLLFGRVRASRQTGTVREYRFLLRLYDATELFSTMTVLCGMLGTCLGLLEAFPELARSLDDQTDAGLLQQVFLRGRWSATVAGLIIGGLWGETLRFFLKPYIWSRLPPRSMAPQPKAPAPSSGESPPPPEQPFDRDWRAQDPLGMY